MPDTHESSGRGVFNIGERFAALEARVEALESRNALSVTGDPLSTNVWTAAPVSPESINSRCEGCGKEMNDNAAGWRRWADDVLTCENCSPRIPADLLVAVRSTVAAIMDGWDFDGWTDSEQEQFAGEVADTVVIEHFSRIVPNEAPAQGSGDEDVYEGEKVARSHESVADVARMRLRIKTLEAALREACDTMDAAGIFKGLTPKLRPVLDATGGGL